MQAPAGLGLGAAGNKIHRRPKKSLIRVVSVLSVKTAVVGTRAPKLLGKTPGSLVENPLKEAHEAGPQDDSIREAIASARMVKRDAAGKWDEFARHLVSAASVDHAAGWNTPIPVTPSDL